MKKSNLILLRLLIAAACGLIAMGLALRAGWNVARSGGSLTYPQRRTQYALTAINLAVTAYHQKNHRIPVALNDLDLSKEKHAYFNSSGAVDDGWYVPFRYTVQGNHYLVTSYGADRKPGGIGLEADLTSDNPYPPEAALTFSWFLTEPDTQGMIGGACASGLLTFLLCLYTVKPASLTRQDIPKLIVGLLVLLVGASVMGIIITILHYPSGH